jgi:DNA-binding CsgD family transcriptional regulator
VHAETERALAAAARHREQEAAEAVAVGSELISQLRQAAAAGIGELAIASAEVATAEAEWAGLRPGGVSGTGGASGSGGVSEAGEVARWRDVVGRWDALRFPYPAAHARLRLSHALLSGSGSSEEASEELRSALAAADALGATVLSRQIRELGARARVELESTPGGDEPAGAGERAASGLTARERQVLELLAEGCSNRRIAKTLFISEKTASVHVTHILAKLQVTNRSEAGALARSRREVPGDAGVTGGGGQPGSSAAD